MRLAAQGVGVAADRRRGKARPHPAVDRGSVRPLYGMPALSPLDGQIANYDAVVAAQRDAIQRREALSRQADALLAKYNEIEALKEPLQARIYELTLAPGPSDRPGGD